MALAPKKRNRHTVVCIFCKKRKLKCDKAQPCSSCIKFGKEECIYEDLGISYDLKVVKTTQAVRNEITILANRIKKLQEELPSPMEIDMSGLIDPAVVDSVPVESSKSSNSSISTPATPYNAMSNKSTHTFSDFLGKNPIAEYDDKISFEELTGTSLYRHRLRRAHSVFTCFCLMKSDAILSPFLSYLHNRIVVQNTKIQPLLKGDFKQVEEDFESKNDVINGVGDIQLYSESESQKHQKHGSNAIGFHGPQSFDGPDYVEKLSNAIARMLPPKKMVWNLIEVFFFRIYPIFPIIDQKDFFNSISQLIGKPDYSDTEIISIRVERRIDFGALGILLIVLRLSYLNLISNHSKGTDHKRCPTIDELLNNPIKLETYFLSKKCLELFDLLNTSSTTVFQLALLHRIYLVYAPEEGDDGEREAEATSFNGIITNVAIGLGFNRERTFSFTQTPSPRQKNLYRKIWNSVQLLNIHHSAYSGSRLSLRRCDSDTKLPVVEPGNENILDPKVEVAVMATFIYRNSFIPQVVDVINIVSNVRERAEMYKLSKILETLENDVIKSYGNEFEKLDENYGSRCELTKTLDLRIYLQVIYIDISLLIFFMNYYEKKKNSKMVLFYAKKIIITVGLEFAPLFFKVLVKGNEIFPNLGVFFINPDLITNMYKMLLVLIAFYLRVKADIHHYSTENGSESLLSCMESSCQLLQSILKIMLDRFISQSSIYYAAWASSKQIAIFYDCMMKDDVFKFDKMSKKKGFVFKEDDYEEFNQILKSVSGNLYKVWADLEKNRNENGIHGHFRNDPTLTMNKTSQETYLNSEIDKIWEEVIQVKTDNQKPNDLMNIANYENVEFDDAINGFTSLDNTLFDGPSLDQLLKTYIDGS